MDTASITLRLDAREKAIIQDYAHGREAPFLFLMNKE